MKVRLLKKLREQAKQKYTIEPYPINEKLIDYRIMLNENGESKTLFHYHDLGKAIVDRNKLRRKDIEMNLGIIRYQRFKKMYK